VRAGRWICWLVQKLYSDASRGVIYELKTGRGVFSLALNIPICSNYLRRENYEITICSFTNNTANEGGGMGNYFTSNPTLSETTICNNTPDQIYGEWTDKGGNTVEDECECLADINGDGYVNVSDLLAIIAAWGLDCDGCSEDVNKDANVNVTDLLIAVGNWGPCE
jgi:hypothetical protein